MSDSPGLKRLRPPDASPEPEEGFRSVVAALGEAERDLVRAARRLAEAEYGDACLASGEPALAHALGTAGIVAELKLDAEALAAALLVPVAEVCPARLPEVRSRCGAAAAGIVEGVARMGHIHALTGHPAAADSAADTAQQEALRKMLLAMVQDTRVVLVKLADHTQDLRFAVKSADPAAARRTAQLTGDIFAPLANRLGVWRLKWEMEDLAFRVLEPELYRRIARLLDEKRLDRERYIENVVARLRNELARAGIAAEVSGRPKHIYSIYRKMRRKSVDFDSLYDIRAVRVLVEDTRDCYAALGLVHQLWTPIPGEFDDYIAKPKANHYRSLHTAVIGPEDKALEVQIRTHEMHQHAELGIASHWRYKEGLRGDPGYDRKIAWLRQLLEWKEEGGEAGGLAERFRTGLDDDTIYVLTPQGRVIALARGATPVDFAYHIHTELGHRCRGARVDGVMVPLNTPLANGQQVEIVAAKQGGPSRDWLNPELGYVKSGTARAKIRQWFNRHNLEADVSRGRLLVERELRRLGATALAHDRLAARLGYARAEELLADVGRGEVRPRQIENAVRALDPQAAPAAADGAPGAAFPRPRATPRGGGVLIVGVDSLLTVPARCCKPVPPEAIVGFVTRGRGVTIHRANCESLARLDARRRVAAEWRGAEGALFAVEIEIAAEPRAALYREVTEALAREKVPLIASRAIERGATMRLRCTVEVADLEQLGRVLALLRGLRGVAHAVRR